MSSVPRALVALVAVMLLGVVACQDPTDVGDGGLDSSVDVSGEAMSGSGEDGEGAGGDVLRVHQSPWPDSLAPQKIAFINAIAVTQMNYEGLTRFDAELQTVPAAAERWEYNDDASSITFHLRPDLTYSDGSPLTAQDFADAVRRTLDPRDPGDYQTSLRMIEGADAVMGAAIPTDTEKLPALFDALGVEVPDERTITFDFVQPTPYFHTLAGIWVMFPTKQALIDAGGEAWYEDPANHVGNGPWQITTIDRANNLIEFEPNARYWAGPPKLDGVQFRYVDDAAVALQAYKRGELDIIHPDADDVPTLQADATLGSELHMDPGSCTFVVFLNHDRPPFDEKGVREAFAYAFDRDSYNRDAYKDTYVSTLTWIPPGFPGHDPAEARYAFDADLAAEWS